jgi:hypothetical protein
MDKKPSELWKDYLHDNRGLTKAARASYDLWLDKYAKRDKDNLPEEKMTDKLLIAGKIYSFLYVTNERPDPKKRPVIDRYPILLSFGTIIKEGKTLETGIDLMLMPPNIRVIFFDRLWKYYKNIIEQNEKNINEGRKGKKALRLNYGIASKMFDKLGWQMAYTTFDRTKMAKISIVDYGDWVPMIALYTKGLQGKTVAQVYETYIKNITTPIETGLEI